MRWSRGDLTFIFNGEDIATSNQLSIVVLDNKTRQYQRMKLLGSVSLCVRVGGVGGWGGVDVCVCICT